MGEVIRLENERTESDGFVVHSAPRFVVLERIEDEEGLMDLRVAAMFNDMGQAAEWIQETCFLEDTDPNIYWIFEQV